jgi:ABC-type transport system involved in cytochrome c biogenesis permease subunit
MALSAIVPIIAMTFLGKQPKEVTAAICSVYIAILSVVTAVFTKKKGKRSLAMIAFATCIVFTAVFVIYLYLAFSR